MTAKMNKHQTLRGWVTLTALLLVMIWLPATSHDWLEAAGWIHAHEDSGHAARHDAADGDCRVEHGALVLKIPAFAPQPWLAIVDDEATSVLGRIRFSQIAVAFPGTAPPELSTTWQFSHRTAGPNRAPPALG